MKHLIALLCLFLTLPYQAHAQASLRDPDAVCTEMLDKNKSCNVDTECAIYEASCKPCECYQAYNTTIDEEDLVDLKRFGRSYREECEACTDLAPIAKCIDNQCTNVVVDYSNPNIITKIIDAETFTLTSGQTIILDEIVIVNDQMKAATQFVQSLNLLGSEVDVELTDAADTQFPLARLDYRRDEKIISLNQQLIAKGFAQAMPIRKTRVVEITEETKKRSAFTDYINPKIEREDRLKILDYVDPATGRVRMKSDF